MAARFNANYRGIGDLLRSAEMEAEMVRRARKVFERAVATAPVDENSPHAGRYKDSFTVTSSRRGGVKHDRASAKVENDAPESFFVEYGNRNVPRHRTLGRSLDAARD